MATRAVALAAAAAALSTQASAAPLLPPCAFVNLSYGFAATNELMLDSAMECFNMCRRESGCKVFTWNTTSRWCYLQTELGSGSAALAGMVPTPGVVSGELPCNGGVVLSVKDLPDCVVYNSGFLPMAGTSANSLWVAEPKACFQLCELEDAVCNYYTWDTTSGQCSLVNSTSQSMVSLPGVVGGPVTCSFSSGIALRAQSALVRTLDYTALSTGTLMGLCAGMLVLGCCVVFGIVYCCNRSGACAKKKKSTRAGTITVDSEALVHPAASMVTYAKPTVNEVPMTSQAINTQGMYLRTSAPMPVPVHPSYYMKPPAKPAAGYAPLPTSAYRIVQETPPMITYSTQQPTSHIGQPPKVYYTAPQVDVRPITSYHAVPSSFAVAPQLGYETGYETQRRASGL